MALHPTHFADELPFFRHPRCLEAANILRVRAGSLSETLSS
jgi:hypothetical protein